MLTLVIAAGWKAELVNTFTYELASNIFTQYFTFTAIKTVAMQALDDPGTYIAPIINNAMSTATFVSGGT